MTRYALVLIAAAAGLTTSAAFATTASETRITHVSWADLDLSRDAGVEQLYARLRGAAQSTCGDADNRDLHALEDQKRCLANTLRRAVHQVHSDRLTSRYLADTAHARPALG